MSARIKGKGLNDPQLLELLEQFLSALKEAFTLKEELQNATTK